MSPKLKFTGGVFLLLLIFLTTVILMNPTKNPREQSSDYQVETLGNDLTLIHEHRDQPPVIALRLFLPVGSSHDPENRAGLAHLTAKTLVKQTRDKSIIDLNRYKSRHGLKISASVHYDFTEFSFTAIPDHREALLDILHEILTEPSFQEDAINHLKQQQYSSLLQRRDNAFRNAFDRALRSYYGSHPYADPPLGSLKELKTLTTESVKSFYEKNYSETGLIVSSSGKIKKKSLVQVLGKLKLPGSPPEPPEHKLPDPEDNRIVEQRTVDQPTHVLLYDAPDIKNEHYVNWKVTDALLGGGMGSLLFHQIREERSMGYQVGSSYPSRRLSSTFRIYLGGGSRDGSEFKNVLEENLERLAEEGPESQSLEKAREYLKGNFLLEHETPGQIAWYRGFYEVMGRGAEFDKTYPERIEGVTGEDVQNTAKKLLEESPLHYSVVPEKDDHD